MKLDLREQRKWIIWIALVCFVSLWAGRFVAGTSPEMALGVFAGLVILLTGLVAPNAAIVIIIFAMLLSPEIVAGQVPTRGVTMRVEDILLVVLFLAWLAKLSIKKEWRFLRNTPLNVPIGTYIFIVTVATFLGTLVGDVNPKIVPFYILKYAEYFMIYFLVTNILSDPKQVKVFIALFLVTAFIVCLYGYRQFAIGEDLTAPFEGTAEPNTLGGYILFVMAIVIGLFAHSRLPRRQMLLGCLFIFAFPILLKSHSRCTYLGFIPMWLTIVLLTKRKKVFLITVLIMFLLLSPFITPQSVKDRIKTTFTPPTVGAQRYYREYEFIGEKVTLDQSASSRVDQWKMVFRTFPRSPLLGHGITGVGFFIEGELVRILGESGLLGIWAFIWLITTIFRVSLHNLGEVKDDFSRGLITGFVGGFVGLLVHALTTNTFIIVRIMEPFWFITAIVVMLPRIMAKEEAKAVSF